jgi:hypothetical protein
MIDTAIRIGILIGSKIYDHFKSKRDKQKALAEANKKLPGVDQIQFPVVTESDPIPVLFGTHWLRTPNVLWYGFLDSRQNNQDRENTVIRYKGCMLLAYCAGPVDYVIKINGDGTSVFEAPYFPIIDDWIDLTSGAVDFDVDAPNLWGDPYNKGGGGLVGRMTFLPGLPNQITPQLFTEPIYRGVYPIGEGPFYQPFNDENGDPYMPAFRGVFTVLLGHYVPYEQIIVGDSSAVPFEFGTSPIFRPIEIMAQRMYQRGFGAAQWYPQAVESLGLEMNPAHIIHELLTDPVYGYGIAAGDIDDTINAPVSTFQSAANRLVADSLGLSFVWGQQQTRLDTIKEVLRHISAFLVRNPKTGKYELRLLRDDYNAATLQVYGPDKIQSVIRYTRPDMSMLPTILEAKYMDRETNIERIVKQDDQAGLLTRGEIREEVYYQLVARGEVAARIATNHMLELSAPLAIVELSIPYAHGEDLLPGDVFVWSWPDYGVDQMVLRVLSVTRGMLEDGNVRVRCTEDAYAWRDTVYSEPPESQWVDPVTPPLPALSLGIELPLLLWVASARDSSPWARIDDFASDERGVASLLVRPQTADHVSYDLYSEGLSNLPRLVDSGAGWSSRVLVDGEYRPTSFGVDALPATTTLRLKFDSAVPQVGDVVIFTVAGGGKQPQEFVYVIGRNFVLGAWEIEVERAIFDTDELFSTGADDGFSIDPVGAIIGRLRDIEDPIQIDRNYSVDVPKDVVASGGESLLRAITTTGRGILPFDDAIQISVPIEGRPFLPIPPYIALITETTDRTIVAWRHRNRLIDRLVFTNQNVAPEPSTEYNLSIYEVQPTPRLLRTVSGIANTENGYAYLYTDEETDRGGGLADSLRFEVEAERDGKFSYYVNKRFYRRVAEPEPLEVFFRLSTGNDFSLAIKEDSTLWGWGKNDAGQNGTGAQRSQPTQVGSDADWRVVSGGEIHAQGVKSDGTLWGWGSNNSGRNGTGANRTSPTQVQTDTDWVFVSAGLDHSLAIKSDGSLWAWGSDVYGQLGTPTGSSFSVPTRVGVDNDWAFVCAGGQFTLAIKTDGTLWRWGIFYNFQSTLPVKVGLDTDWVMASTTTSHAQAIKSDGTLWGWGRNELGENGTGATRRDPAQVGLDSDWKFVAAGLQYSIAIKADGTLWGWGNNTDGKNGTGANRTSPTQVQTDTDWALIDAGTSHSQGIKDQGTLYGWGSNLYGENGTGLPRNIPIQVGTDNDWL